MATAASKIQTRLLLFSVPVSSSPATATLSQSQVAQ